MGGFISGPVIKFSLDESGLVASVQAALANVGKQVVAQNQQISKSITSSIANPLIAQAAQLRALYSTGVLGIQQVQVQQKALLGLLDQEISKLATRNDLSNKELSTLKALTLERERQQNALNRGVGVGVTAGTTSALSTVSGPIIANISRLGTGLLGVSGASGGEATAFSAAASGIAAIAEFGGVATTVLAGLSIGLLAAGAAASALAISGGNLVQRLSDISQKTGISIQNLQVLEAIGKTTDASLEDLVTGFRKFSQALVSGGGDDASGGFNAAGKKSAEILQVLGVTSKDSFTAIEQVADAFQKLPDGPTKAAAAIQLFGRSGLQLIPILNQGRDGVLKFQDIVAQFGPTITNNAVKSQDDWKTATEKLSLAFDSLKVSAVPLLDLLSKLTTSAAGFLAATSNSQPGTPSGLAVGLLGAVGNPAGVIASVIENIGSIGTKSDTSTQSLDGLAKGFAVVNSMMDGTNKQLQDLLSGRLDALNKLIAEGTKELQALNEEQSKAALGKLNAFTLAGQTAVPGASPADDILAKQRQDLEAIAEIMLNFPNLANQVSGAVVGVTNTTISGLQKLADEALKKTNDNEDAEMSQQLTNQKSLSALILGVDNDLAISQAKSTKDVVATIISEEQKRLAATIANATILGATEQQLQDLRVKAYLDANARIALARQDELDKTNKQVQQEAGQLFDALVRGGGSFTTALKNSLENLLLSPVKQVFEGVIAGIFTKPVQDAKDALAALGKALQNNNPKGSILSQIGKNLSPDSAMAANVTALNANTAALLGLGASLTTGALNPFTGQLPLGNVFGEIANLSGGVETLPLPLGDVSKELSNLTGVLIGSGSSGASSPSSLSSVIGKLVGVFTGASSKSVSGSGTVLFGGIGGAGGLILHNQGTGAGSSISLSSLAKAGLGASIANLAGGLATHNVGQAIGGGIGVAGNGLATIGSLLGKDSDLGKTLGQVGGVIGGAGLVISGVSQGGLSGGLSSALGGAEIGATFGGPVGAAVGAIAGFAAGLIGGLFHKKGPTAAQINAAIKKQTVDSTGTIFANNAFVGTEFDRAVGTSFGSTLNTTFSEGPGGTFSTSAINGPSQGPTVSPTFVINAMDSKDVAAFFKQHGPTIAKSIAGQINSTQSGMARNIRSIVNPA